MSPVTWSTRSDDKPPTEVTAWLEWVTDALPEGVKAIVLLDVPMENGVRGESVMHAFEDDEDVLASWRRHLRVFQMNRIGREEPDDA